MHRLEHLHLLVAHGVGGEVDRWLHRGQGEQLQEVVLEDVADCPGRLVEAGAPLDTHRLGHRDLDVVDELPVPDRLEDAVGEPQREHVLHRLLAEIVIDAEDLVLAEPAMEELVQLPGRPEVVAERLLDDETDPALLGTPLSDLRHSRRECLRRHCEIVEPVAIGTALGVELLERAPDAVFAPVVVELGADVSDPGRERVPTRPGGTGRARTASPPSSCRLRTGPSSAACARHRRSRTAPARAFGTRARREPE